MKKVEIILAMLFLTVFGVFSQETVPKEIIPVKELIPVFKVNIDSVKDNIIYFQMVRFIPDTLNLRYAINDVKEQIKQLNERLQYQRSLKNTTKIALRTDDYSGDFKSELKAQKDEITQNIKRMLIDKQQLIAIRDSTNSFLKK